MHIILRALLGGIRHVQIYVLRKIRTIMMKMKKGQFSSQ